MPDDLQTELDELDVATLAVRDLIGSSHQMVGRMAQVMGMNANDMSAIGMLVAQGPMGVTELGHRLGIRSASATVLADRLVQAGHIERVRDTIDRRRVVLTATAAARTTSLTAWLPMVREIDRVCRTLTEVERTFVLAFLGRLTAASELGGPVP